MTHYKADGTTTRQPRAHIDQISTYAKAVDFHLNSFDIYSTKSKATLETAAVKLSLQETLVQFANVFRTKVVCVWNDYPVECTKKAFIDALPAYTKSSVTISGARKQKAHL